MAIGAAALKSRMDDDEFIAKRCVVGLREMGCLCYDLPSPENVNNDNCVLCFLREKDAHA